MQPKDMNFDLKNINTGKVFQIFRKEKNNLAATG